MYIYIYDTEKDTEKDTERKRHRERDTEKETQRKDRCDIIENHIYYAWVTYIWI